MTRQFRLQSNKETEFEYDTPFLNTQMTKKKMIELCMIEREYINVFSFEDLLKILDVHLRFENEIAITNEAIANLYIKMK